MVLAPSSSCSKNSTSRFQARVSLERADSWAVPGTQPHLQLGMVFRAIRTASACQHCLRRSQDSVKSTTFESIHHDIMIQDLASPKSISCVTYDPCYTSSTFDENLYEHIDHELAGEVCPWRDKPSSVVRRRYVPPWSIQQRARTRIVSASTHGKQVKRI